MTIVSIIAYGVFRGWTFYVVYWRFPYFESYYFLALITFLYYLFFEGIWKRTPGKWLSLSKVVTKRGGGKPSFGQIIIRCFIRVMGVIVIDSIFLSFLNQTLHDYVSGTEVVEI